MQAWAQHRWLEEESDQSMLRIRTSFVGTRSLHPDSSLPPGPRVVQKMWAPRAWHAGGERAHRGGTSEERENRSVQSLPFLSDFVMLGSERHGGESVS